MKQRTKSAAKKRIRKTGSGKLMMVGAAKNHLLSSKSKTTRQKKAGGVFVAKGHAKALKSVI